ncbi:MFS transporter [Phenylobacterium sp.]|jgi:predicted MFS family arabinose efflux permease|uniref:MFS transporter n=1 Tax=Phenylobacterium sp. TaxID=1871053 RepID=UPI0037C54F7A
MAEGKGYSEFRTGWPVVLASMLGIGLGLSPVPFYTIGMLAPELAREFGWAFGDIMAGLPIMTFAVLVASPAVGFLADRVGVRPIALISVLLFGVSFMAFAANPGDIRFFYANWAIMAVLGAGTLPITWTRAVNNRFEDRKGFALGLSLLGTGVFGFLVKPFTAFMIDAYGWRAAYMAVGALPLILALPVAYFAFHDVGERNQSAADRRESDTIRAAATPGLTFSETLRNWRFWVLAIAFVPISFGVGGPIPNMENIVKTAGFSGPDIVSLVSLIGLSVIAGRVVGGWLIDRFWAPGIAFLMICAPALACWMFAHGDLTYATAAGSIILIGFAAGVEYDLMAFLVARYFGLKSYGAIYGSLYGFFALGAGIGPVVFGRAFDADGNYDSPLMLSAGLLVLGAVLLLLLGRYRTFGSPDESKTA